MTRDVVTEVNKRIEGHEHDVSVEEMGFIPVEVTEAGETAHYEIFPQLDEDNIRAIREDAPETEVRVAVGFPGEEKTYRKSFTKGQLEGPDVRLERGI